MAKPTGFLEYARADAVKRPVPERLKDWHEIRLPHKQEEITRQAARCMNCGIPFCHSGVMLRGMASGCPVRNLIPEWNDLVYRGQWREAYLRLIRTNPFPEFTGRVCPAPCEGSCTEGCHMEAVAISALEYEIIERAFREGWVKPLRAVSRKESVAVVGSGPAGLSAAHYLAGAGYGVTVIERGDRPGGLLTYGIPNMKLDKAVVERRVSLLRESGIEFLLNTEVGRDIGAAELLKGFDAVALCGGAAKARGLDVPGSNLGGVRFAVDFLSESTKSLLAGRLPREELNARGRRVIILGGGDTGTDCAATALRQGCKSLTQFEIMPKPPARRDPAGNPWPEWPKILKTDYGQEEAAWLMGEDPRRYGISAKELTGDEGGRVRGVRAAEVEWVKNDAGRLVPREIPGSEKLWEADLVLLAMGFLGPEDTLPDAFGLERDERSCVKAAYGSFKTSREKVFAAGDMRRGQSLVVWAIQEGKVLAREIDRFLSGGSLIGE